jgi:hypothetical protein
VTLTWWTSTRSVGPSSRVRPGGRAEARYARLLVNERVTEMRVREHPEAAGNRSAQVHGASEGPAPAAEHTGEQRGVKTLRVLAQDLTSRS